ncbi:hypothetical protein Ahu01nite_100330 [Winogradskya humida]|uniref:YbaB/EbfC DNA-binding family protein n=2 Tax=Winogradskya humida TaxID=113566 RepID=A0ABQ4A7Y0_9ACTN|nr:hypothetical protein Ahu01nite_100330 [Actinoplanes humidus]
MLIDDHVESLRALQHEATVLARQLATASASGGDAFTGADDTGTVEATISADGGLQQVRIAQSWHSTLGDSGLGSALVAALTSAATARLTAWTQGFTQPVSPDPPASAVAEVASADVGDPASPQSALALRDLLDLLDQVDEQTPAAIAAAQAAAGEQMSAANVARTVRVTATAGVITSADFDRDWVRSADPARIAEAIIEAVQAAQLLTAQQKQDRLDSVPAVARLLRVTDSPKTLWHEIGLIR